MYATTNEDRRRVGVVYVMFVVAKGKPIPKAWKCRVPSRTQLIHQFRLERPYDRRMGERINLSYALGKVESRAHTLYYQRIFVATSSLPSKI